jgi:RNA polymerase sigma factor (sigma-70 family)
MLRLVRSQHPPTGKLGSQADTLIESEALLLQRITQGDALAFEQFYKAYYPRLYRFILRMTHQPEAVEELIQETLLVVWENPQHYNQTSKISTWVLGIAYHKALKHASKTAARQHLDDVDDYQEILPDRNANQAQHQENVDWISNALAVLSAEQRAVIELTFYHGLSYQEIAKILDCPENTVKTRMFHARKKLQSFADSQEI